MNHCLLGLVILITMFDYEDLAVNKAIALALSLPSIESQSKKILSYNQLPTKT